MAVNGAANGASGANESSGPTRTVLVTEGAGYIGSHAVLQLLAAGFRAVVVDSLENSSELAVRRVAALSGEHARNLSFHKVDIRDEDALDAVFASTRFDAVIHFAGLKAVGESVRKPLFYYDHNIAGTINLLKVMAAHEYKKPSRDGDRRRKAGVSLRAGPRPLPRRVVLVQGGHHPAVRRPPRHGARPGRVRRLPSARPRGALVRRVQPAADRRRGRGAAGREGGPRRPQLRRLQPRAGHAGAPGQGGRRRLRRRGHAGRRVPHVTSTLADHGGNGDGRRHGQRARRDRRGGNVSPGPRAPVAAAVPAKPGRGPGAGDGAGEAGAVVPRRRGDDGERPDRRQVRRGEARVRGHRGGRDVGGGLPAPDGVAVPRRGGGGHRGCRPHAHVLHAPPARRDPHGDRRQVHLS